MSLFDLTGKVAIVTGSTKGIGEAIVHRMAEHGAKVVVSSRKGDACDRVAGEINAKYKDSAIAVPCNISDKGDLERLVATTMKQWGRVDSLVCNAAVNPYFGPSKDLPDDAFDKIMSANIKSNHWLAHMVLPQMVERKDGSITIISSIGGLRGSPILGAYCVSKAADMQLARNLAVEYGPQNIRVNCIAPGVIESTGFKQYSAEAREQFPRGNPMLRQGDVQDIAHAVIYLTGPSGKFITGELLNVDGGGVLWGELWTIPKPAYFTQEQTA